MLFTTLLSTFHRFDQHCINMAHQVFAPTAEQYKAAEQAVLAVSGGNLTVRMIALMLSKVNFYQLM